MAIKDTKLTFLFYLPYECAAVEGYLEQMAEKGWLLQSVLGPFFKFKKIKPIEIRYSANILPQVPILNNKDSDAALEYREHYQAEGWNYVCQTGKTQIFYSEDNKKTISIHTDEEEKFKLVYNASGYVENLFILTLMYIFDKYYRVFVKNELSTDILLTSNLSIFLAFIMLSFIVIVNIEAISFFIWMIKARGELKENKFMPYNNYKQLRRKNIVIKGYILITLLAFLCLLILDNVGNIGFDIYLIIVCSLIIIIYVQEFINKKKYSKTTNSITISSIMISIYLVLILMGGMIFSSITKTEQSEVITEKGSLKLMDFGYKENGDTSPYNRFYKSILAQRIYYSYCDEANDLTYKILQSPYPWVVKFHENRLLSLLNNNYGVGLKQEDSNLPGNIKVYSDSNKRNFVLVSEDKVVEITKDFSDISDVEFLNKVYKKLFQ